MKTYATYTVNDANTGQDVLTGQFDSPKAALDAWTRAFLPIYPDSMRDPEYLTQALLCCEINDRTGKAIRRWKPEIGHNGSDFAVVMVEDKTPEYKIDDSAKKVCSSNLKPLTKAEHRLNALDIGIANAAINRLYDRCSKAYSYRTPLMKALLRFLPSLCGSKWSMVRSVLEHDECTAHNDLPPNAVDGTFFYYQTDQIYSACYDVNRVEFPAIPEGGKAGAQTWGIVL